MDFLNKNITKIQGLINIVIRRDKGVTASNAFKKEIQYKRIEEDTRYEDFRNYIIDLFIFGFTQAQIAYFVGNKMTTNGVSAILNKQKIKIQPRKPINIYLIQRLNGKINTQLKYNDEKWMIDLLKQELIICRLNTERKIKLDKIGTLENEVRK